MLTTDKLTDTIINKEIDDMSKMKMVTNKDVGNKEVSTTQEAAAEPIELNCFGYVFFKSPKNGTYYTVKVKFDSDLTTAEFSDKEVAGDERQLAIEKLKILLGSKVF